MILRHTDKAILLYHLYYKYEYKHLINTIERNW